MVVDEVSLWTLGNVASSVGALDGSGGNSSNAAVRDSTLGSYGEVSCSCPSLTVNPSRFLLPSNMFFESSSRSATVTRVFRVFSATLIRTRTSGRTLSPNENSILPCLLDS
jgi:hypothetical protein